MSCIKKYESFDKLVKKTLIKNHLPADEGYNQIQLFI